SKVNPPAIKTRPSASSVDLCEKRGVVMLPVGVKVPVGCAKATLQNDRTRSNRNAANLLVIFVPQFLLGSGLVTKIWVRILSNKAHLTYLFGTEAVCFAIGTASSRGIGSFIPR